MKVVKNIYNVIYVTPTENIVYLFEYGISSLAHVVSIQQFNKETLENTEGAIKNG
jgi:hypothetical protein